MGGRSYPPIMSDHSRSDLEVLLVQGFFLLSNASFSFLCFYIQAGYQFGLLYMFLCFPCSYVPSLNVFVLRCGVPVVLAGLNHFSVSLGCILLIILVAVRPVNNLYC